ncbi:hypothetical protein [Undibacterium parvum]|uniref:Uncharacterized protein n=1 Tax=Undibacterium parvum TaxID=401471 RepID=A0A3S9HEK4_9BURK|nr:hypothetical protein [Undibacterium parvum]AZP10566.1 hypothetical protein EJN92_00065 [Undibacterium parvum]
MPNYLALRQRTYSQKKITDYMSPEGLVFMTPYWELCLKGEVTGYRRSYQDPHTGQARVVDVMMEPEISQEQCSDRCLCPSDRRHR